MKNVISSPSFAALSAVVLSAVLFTGLFNGCAKAPQTDSSRQYQVLWPDGAGNYTLQNRQLPTLQDAKALKGSAADVMVNPTIGTYGIESAGTRARYIIESGGSWIPSDYTSLQGLTIYAHAEALMLIDQETGAAKSMVYPTRIGFFDGPSDEMITNNAFYAVTDFMVFGSYSGPMLPTSLNAGVISHEHFHKIFQALVHEPLKKRSSRTWQPRFLHEWAPSGYAWSDRYNCSSAEDYNVYLMRGINEGLADYWGWIYTADSRFVERSLGFYDVRSRSIDGEISDISDQSLRTEYQRYVDRGECFKRNPYLVGTRIARWMKSVATAELSNDVSQARARLKYAKKLISALPRLTDTVAKTQTGELQMANIMRVLVESNPTSLSCGIYSKQIGIESKPVGCP